MEFSGSHCLPWKCQDASRLSLNTLLSRAWKRQNIVLSIKKHRSDSKLHICPIIWGFDDNISSFVLPSESWLRNQSPTTLADFF